MGVARLARIRIRQPTECECDDPWSAVLRLGLGLFGPGRRLDIRKASRSSGRAQNPALRRPEVVSRARLDSAGASFFCFRFRCSRRPSCRKSGRAPLPDPLSGLRVYAFDKPA